jgi:hypothetical protein
MISPFDDFCLHQTPDYLRVPGTTDRNFYDRYFFSGYRREGGLVFGLAFGRYPNRFVQDAHFTVLLDGVQYSLHASDVLGADPSRNVVGPVEISVVEPMRVLRCHATGNDTGIACDLIFRAETGAIDEGRRRVGREGMTYIDQTRFMQYGSWEGWIEVDGRRTTLGPGEAFGLRDKSWGVRLIGDQHATQRRGGQIFWMNVVMRLEDRFCVIRTLDHADGTSHEREGYSAPLYASAAQVPVGEMALRRVAHWDFELEFPDGTRRIRGGRYAIRWADGEESVVEGRAIGTLWYAGMGYNHERWHHGLDHGGVLVVEREEWRADDVDMTRLDRQFLASVMEFRIGGRVVGFGHTEQLLMGEFRPFGWGEFDYAGLPLHARPGAC